MSAAVRPLAHVWCFDALGTRWEISTPVPLADDVARRVTDELDRIDRVWSRFRDDSTVAEIGRRAGRYPIAAADQPLIDWYRRLYDLTGGAVSPMVGQVLVDAGYDAGYSLAPKPEVAPAPRWDDVLAGHTGSLDVRRPVLLDVGAAGKGFAVDRVAGIVGEEVDSYVVDGSGDMRIRSSDGPLRVALEHPVDVEKAIGLVELDDGAICASAANRRAWADWHHIVDPRSGAPAREVLASWVIAPDTMTADGLATALFFTPASILRSAFDFHAAGFHHVTIRRNGTVEHTDIPGLELFL
ncbi:FAD:protein FMN transferase [Gordonia sp. SL306]|uniref:FAD:protein FMN transferase n=1 Tax=Gordonia sp. SL306 TaxID=2995145 RepID=UPI002271F52E|nr:FAD:protein FMN transferase [Gordonia sp. SL306]WAC54382.1 FAD:protein FMN transferase [Gordonia sp. SL306]